MAVMPPTSCPCCTCRGVRCLFDHPGHSCGRRAWRIVDDEPIAVAPTPPPAPKVKRHWRHTLPSGESTNQVWLNLERDHDREAQIVTLCANGLSRQEVGSRLGITASRVGQILRRLAREAGGM